MPTEVILLQPSNEVIGGGGVQVIGGVAGPPGASSAAGVSFDDTLAQLGAASVQQAIEALLVLIQAGGLPSGAIDLSNPNKIINASATGII
ncbi:hypothetical protein [Phenylobacterium sp.]|jgi:hypothetical protein|uniref:hypothetical protein n=1 Tax=Phenylobacterium sp. TaxID=1871053 RepID=UPI002F407C25